MKSNNLVFVWASDFEDFTGEGILARSFIKSLFHNSNKKINIKSNNAEYVFYKKRIKIIKYSNYKSNFVNKYLKVFCGLYYLWKAHILGYATFYINYLPLWNFLLLILLPKKTNLGPITGGKFIIKEKSINSYIRKYLFPFFFKFSVKIISTKYKNFLFSTRMLIEYLPKNLIQKSLFEVNLICFDELKIIDRKDINYLFYYRIHSNKSNNFLKKLIKNLTNQNDKVFIVGDYLEGKNLVNLGNISRNRLQKYLSRTKFSLNSGENFYSLFALDCISNDVDIFIDKKNYLKSNYFPKNNLHIIDYKYFDRSYVKILKTKKSKKISKKNILIKRKKELIKKINKNFDII